MLEPSTSGKQHWITPWGNFTVASYSPEINAVLVKRARYRIVYVLSRFVAAVCYPRDGYVIVILNVHALCPADMQVSSMTSSLSKVILLKSIKYSNTASMNPFKK